MGKKTWQDIIVSDTDNIPGKKIIKSIGKIKIKHDATDFKKHAKWAFNATDKLKKIAYKLGANAITNIKFTYRGNDNVHDGMAIIVENED